MSGCGCSYVFDFGRKGYGDGPFQARKKDFPKARVTHRLDESTRVLDIQQEVQRRRRAVE